MNFPKKFDMVKSGWSIVYLEGSQVNISKKKNSISFSEDPFCLSSNNFQKYPFRGVSSLQKIDSLIVLIAYNWQYLHLIL